jgi:hypothetical protein
VVRVREDQNALTKINKTVVAADVKITPCGIMIFFHQTERNCANDLRSTKVMT